MLVARKLVELIVNDVPLCAIVATAADKVNPPDIATLPDEAVTANFCTVPSLVTCRSCPDTWSLPLVIVVDVALIANPAVAVN